MTPLRPSNLALDPLTWGKEHISRTNLFFHEARTGRDMQLPLTENPTRNGLDNNRKSQGSQPPAMVNTAAQGPMFFPPLGSALLIPAASLWEQMLTVAVSTISKSVRDHLLLRVGENKESPGAPPADCPYISLARTGLHVHA